MNWQIGLDYELIDKGGGAWELGTLIHTGPLTFKKKDGCVHTYTVEKGVTYRLISIPIRTAFEAAEDTRNTVLPY